jgi:predicted N-acetyltransferase YhbS
MAYFSHNTYAIDWLAVSPEHQNQGVGARLVTKSCEHIEKEFLKGQRGTILLASDNGPNFYSKFGFEPAFNLHSGDPVMMKIVEGTRQ